jgi:maltose alpha-D-glucosyltransferase / alpha-amylase
MRLQVKGPDGRRLVDVFSDRHSDADESGCHRLDLKPYDYRWYRVGSADNALNRSER